jgi:hypothetical protein
MLKMAPLGLKLLRTGRMSIARERIEKLDQLKKVMDAVEES